MFLDSPSIRANRTLELSPHGPGQLSVTRTPIALPPSSNGNERAMVTQRRRFKQTVSLNQRLADEAERLRIEAKGRPPGFERDQLIRRARQAEAALYMNEWLRSPGLPPPKAGTRLVQDIVRSRLKGSAES